MKYTLDVMHSAYKGFDQTIPITYTVSKASETRNVRNEYNNRNSTKISRKERLLNLSLHSSNKCLVKLFLKM